MTFSRSLSNKLEGIAEAAGRAASLPILLCHGKGMNPKNTSSSREYYMVYLRTMRTLVPIIFQILVFIFSVHWQVQLLLAFENINTF